MEEKEFFNDQVVSVTSARVKMNSLTFALRNISSVRSVTIQPSHALDIFLIIVGVVITIFGLCAAGVGGGAESGGTMGVGIFTILFGIGIVIIGILIYTKKKPTYYVYLGTNAGEQKGIYSQNKTYVDSIVEAINEAIIYKS